MKILFCFFNIVILSLLSSCTPLLSQDINIQVNPDIRYQTIAGFGASDAWRTQFVGENWPNHKKEAIAKLLFSQEFDNNGNPQGIGLSIWRFYIGAGTMEQGEASGIPNEWRRAECFLNIDGTYDWNKQAGQQWFLEKAKEYGVDHILAFSIAPPVQWSKNGKGYPATSGYTMNIMPDKWADYARFMASVVEHFANQGYNIDYLSPVNETQWDWVKGSQEGTPATNEEVSKLGSLLNKEMIKRNLETKIVLPETADLRFLYADRGRPLVGSQIPYFFAENKSNRQESNIMNGIVAHSYFTTTPVDTLISIRKKLFESLKKQQIEYWQSEFCILENSPDIGNGNKRDLGMNTALYVARVIHADLTLANAASWQWWTALTIADYKDGLIYLDTGIKKNMYDRGLLKSDGEFHDSKLLWALGNYSRFIRPGMKRIEIAQETDKSLKEQYNETLISGYTTADQKEMILVAINYADSPKSLNISLDDYIITGTYTTSEGKNLLYENIAENDSISLEKRSVTTILAKRVVSRKN